MRRLMQRFGNRIVALLLRSPLHRLLGGGVMLVTVTGHRSGRRYTTPVQYERSDGELYAVSRRSRSWWRNLRGGAPVVVRVRGGERAGAGAGAAEIVDGVPAPAPRVFEGNSLARAAGRPDAVIGRIRLVDAE